MDKGSWNALLTVAVPLVLGSSIYGLAVARPRHQVLLPFLPTLVASVAIYSSMVHDASSFHGAVTICALLALGFAFSLVSAQPWRNRVAAFSWALLGVVTPFVLLFGLLAVACWGKTECLG